ncbi:phosphatase PAP2 family protein [Clostridia bacterium]|nr:phosphatase PAP2 family protein [Clostridia bacterium]
MPFDFPILYFIQNHMVNPILNVIMPFLSLIGNGGAIWFVTAIILILTKKYRSCGIIILIAVIIGFLSGELLIKNIVARPRPCYIDTTIKMLVNKPITFSFPSGHTCSSFAASVVMLRYNKKIGIPSVALACCIAFSRLYLFVHFPTDVLAGAALGTISSLGSYHIYNRYKPNQKLSGNI